MDLIIERLNYITIDNINDRFEFYTFREITILANFFLRPLLSGKRKIEKFQRHIYWNALSIDKCFWFLTIPYQNPTLFGKQSNRHFFRRIRPQVGIRQ